MKLKAYAQQEGLTVSRSADEPKARSVRQADVHDKPCPVSAPRQSSLGLLNAESCLRLPIAPKQTHQRMSCNELVLNDEKGPRSAHYLCHCPTTDSLHPAKLEDLRPAQGGTFRKPGSAARRSAAP